MVYAFIASAFVAWCLSLVLLYAVVGGNERSHDLEVGE
jgi:hypothetical protein